MYVYYYYIYVDLCGRRIYISPWRGRPGAANVIQKLYLSAPGWLQPQVNQGEPGW